MIVRTMIMTIAHELDTHDLINLLECIFCIEGHVALDRNPGPRYNTLLLPLILAKLLPQRLNESFGCGVF